MRRYRSGLSESSFHKILYLAGGCVLVLLLAIFLSLVIASFPAIRNFGIRFLVNTTWDPVRGKFGAFPFLVFTLATSFFALIISVIFSIPISIFLGEYFTKGTMSTFIKSIIELLAGIPSVIYGFCGLSLLAPVVRSLEIKLGAVPCGVGIFTASWVLSIMIIPYAASIGSEVITLVPSDLKEAALSLGQPDLRSYERLFFFMPAPEYSQGFFSPWGELWGRPWLLQWSSETQTSFQKVFSARATPWPVSLPTNSQKQQGVSTWQV